MEHNRFKINNKEKQKTAGNWGHPTSFQKKQVHISDPLYPNIIKAAKRKKKTKEPYVSERIICPFCEEILPVDAKERQRQIEENEKTREEGYVRYLTGIILPRVKKCPKCKAKEVDDCPCCHKKTWFLKGIYKHQWMSCGFVGKRKKEKHA